MKSIINLCVILKTQNISMEDLRMLKKENIRIFSWSINVDITAKTSAVHLKGQKIEEAKNIILWETKISEEARPCVISILRLAQECNANLLEICSYAKQEVLRFSFEFEFREDFLKFENNIKELAL